MRPNRRGEVIPKELHTLQKWANKINSNSWHLADQTQILIFPVFPFSVFSNSTTLQEIYHANNLMNIQLYNSTEKKSLLVNFLDFPFSIFQLYNSTEKKSLLVNFLDFPFSIFHFPTLQLYKKTTMPIT